MANYIVHLLKNPPTTPPHIYFPPGVRSPLPDQFIPHNTPGGIRTPIPENPDGSPTITNTTITTTSGYSEPKKSLSFTVNKNNKNQDRRVNPLQSFIFHVHT